MDDKVTIRLQGTGFLVYTVPVDAPVLGVEPVDVQPTSNVIYAHTGRLDSMLVILETRNATK
jgi:hypothetical protein